eukprot:365211-Chlamydomonas_euryale.AAC.1
MAVTAGRQCWRDAPGPPEMLRTACNRVPDPRLLHHGVAEPRLLQHGAAKAVDSRRCTWPSSSTDHATGTSIALD